MPRVPAEAFRAPKGVHDVLPPESATWASLVARFAGRAARFGYGLIVSPVFEHIEVFQRVGEHTDVVSKEMYEFTDKGGRTLALRPEGTASVVRAYVQHRPTHPGRSGTSRRTSATSGPRRAGTASTGSSGWRRSASTTPRSTSR